MAVKFDILDFLSGLTGFVFDKSVLARIAWEREVAEVTSFDELDAKMIELLKADLLFTAYLSPNIWASQTNSHGSFSRTTGSQTINAQDRKQLFNVFTAIYKKYNDNKLEEALALESNLQWL